MDACSSHLGLRAAGESAFKIATSFAPTNGRCSSPLQMNNLFILHFDQIHACYFRRRYGDDGLTPLARAPTQQAPPCSQRPGAPPRRTATTA